MIQFFEMLNECSPLRTVAYLLAILAFTFILFGGITDILRVIIGERNTKITEEETNNNDE